jgi:SecD/SecF fusion protein
MKHSVLRGVSLLLVAGAFAAAALSGGTRSAGGAESAREIGTTLIYRIDPESLTNPDQRPNAELLEKIVAALNKRINTGWLKKARIQRHGDDKIEVAIYGADAETAQRIKNLVERAGTLEFRILANIRAHKDIIDRALSEKTPVIRSKTPDENGAYPVLAWWVPMKGSERFKDKKKQEEVYEKLDNAAKERIALDKKRVAGVLGYPEICKRISGEGDKEVDQVLVVKDTFDVTGQYLTEASAGRDRYGKHCVNFRFNAQGGRRFSGLTGNNLPEEGGKYTYKLGIILDGQMNSAPSIQSTIFDRGEITGEFAEDEVKDQVDVLNAGTLPAKLMCESVLERKKQ